MLRVLHFVSTPSIGSGVMSVIMNYYRHMDRSKIQFDFLCFISCRDSYEKEIKKLGGQVFFIPKPSASFQTLTALSNFFKIHGQNYQYLHNHEIYLSFLLYPIAKHYGIPHFLVHCHATQYSDKRIAAFRNRLLCLPIPFLSCRRLACSKAAATFLYGKKAVAEKKVYVFYNAIDAKSYQYSEQTRIELRTKLGYTEHEIVLGHIGRFVPQKNHEFLLKIFKQCLAVNQNVRLLCIGDGTQKPQIEQMAKTLGIVDRIFFTGQIKNAADFLNVMDVFLLPSLFEGYPLSLVEAECNGLPCLISDTISDEIKSNRIFRYSLKQSEKIWAEQALTLASFPRKETQAPLYEITEQAKRLEALYLGENPNPFCENTI